MSYISRILNENLSDNESDDEICILEEITLNKDETKVSPMKTEVRQEVIESTIEIDGTPVFLSPPPTPRLTSTRESAPETASENLNSLRSPSPNATAMSPNPNIIPTVQVKLEVVGEKEDGAEMINESRETSDIFCRFCYQTFFKSSEQLIHEQKDHNVKEDQDALKSNLTDLTIEDFCHTLKGFIRTTLT